MNFPTVSSCCFCIDLKTGGIILGILGIISSITEIVFESDGWIGARKFFFIPNSSHIRCKMKCFLWCDNVESHLKLEKFDLKSRNQRTFLTHQCKSKLFENRFKLVLCTFNGLVMVRNYRLQTDKGFLLTFFFFTQETFKVFHQRLKWYEFCVFFFSQCAVLPFAHYGYLEFV